MDALGRATEKDLREAIEASYEDEVRRLAQAHLPAAIDTLAEIVTGHEVPVLDEAGNPTGETRRVLERANVRRAAANDLIKHGHKHESKSSAEGENAAKGGFTLNFISFGEAAQKGLLQEKIIEQVDKALGAGAVSDDAG